MKLSQFALAALAASTTLLTAAHADSKFATGTGALTASPDLDFRIVVPKILRFEVGTPTTGTIDMVEFDLTSTASTVGSGTDVARTNGGAVAVKLQGNGGAISVTGTTAGALLNGADSVSYSEIISTSDNTALAAPTLVDGAASAAVSVAVSSGSKVVNRTANWTYAYSNTNIVGSGTYGGTVANNGRVTYTAAMP